MQGFCKGEPLARDRDGDRDRDGNRDSHRDRDKDGDGDRDKDKERKRSDPFASKGDPRAACMRVMVMVMTTRTVANVLIWTHHNLYRGVLGGLMPTGWRRQAA